MMLCVTFRLVRVDGAVRFHVVLFVRLTVEVDAASVRIAPVSVEALALRVIALPAVALSRLLFPAFAVVLLRLSVAADGSAKTRSPDRLPMAKLSKVALWPVPPMNAIAVPAAVIVPPPVAAIVAPLPWSATAAAEAFFV